MTFEGVKLLQCDASDHTLVKQTPNYFDDRFIVEINWMIVCFSLLLDSMSVDYGLKIIVLI